MSDKNGLLEALRELLKRIADLEARVSTIERKLNHRGDR